MAKIIDRKQRRARIHLRLRNRLTGQPERPRLVVFRSLRHVYAQVVDDSTHATLASASTLDKEVSEGLSNLGNKAAGRAVGKAIASRAQAKGISEVVFDRAGFRYHGVVRELAEAAREAGLKF
jgi:large subunit ribosomal protein L18